MHIEFSSVMCASFTSYSAVHSNSNMNKSIHHHPHYQHTTAMLDPNDAYAFTLTDLPDWSLRLAFASAEDHEEWTSVGVLSTVTNGDCFYHAIHLGLLSCFPKSALSTDDLRKMVAASVFHSPRNVEIRNILSEWRDILVDAHMSSDRDDTIVREFRHALPLLTAPNAVTDLGALSAVYHAMSDRTRYWADNYAVLILQQILGIHIIVISEPGSVHPPIRRPQQDDFCIIVLNENNDHYRVCVTREHRIAAFRWKNVPQFLHRACNERWTPKSSN